MPIQGDDILRKDRNYYNRFLAKRLANPVNDAKQLVLFQNIPLSDAGTHSPDDVISKHETNVALSDTDRAEAANHLLTAIGMTRLVRVEKSRARYRHPDYDEVTVNLDTIPGVGTFIETEVIAMNGNGATALLEQVEHQLGLTVHPVVSLPYRDLVLRCHQPIDEKVS